MLCENCKKNTATTYFKQTVNGKTSEIFLCAECAAKLGLSDSFAGFGFDSVFAPMFGRPAAPTAQTCPTCGRSLAEISDSGRVGCPDCYTTFRKQLAAVLQRVSGGKTHCGKVPGSQKKAENDDIGLLKKKLEEAIASENFEEAAQLRDKIRNLEKNA